MNRESIWKLTEKVKEYPHLPGDTKVTAAVIGGGMAGILTAYALRQKGVDCIVLEADTIGSGQTGNTTAKITSQHNLIYDTLIQRIGEEKASKYAAINQLAIETYRTLIKELQIDCDFTDCRAYLYAHDNSDALEKEFTAASSLGLPAGLTTKTELPFPVGSALYFEKQARFHPLKFLNAIAEQLTVYEHTPVRKVEDNLLTTDYGTVEAKTIIFACHYPFVNIPGYYFLKLYQERSYETAINCSQEMEHMYLGIDRDKLSFRGEKNLILIGGGGHRTGQNTQGDQYEHLFSSAEKYWPGCVETAKWSAQDCMTLDDIPYIGRYGHSTGNWYVATGFGKWGMTSSMVSAMILSDIITGKHNSCEEVFSPHRGASLAAAGGFFKQGCHAVSGLLGSASTFVKEKNPGLSMRCPHLGCHMTWNADEESFDCPCHGSRFDRDGKLLDGPSQKDMKKKER